MRTNIFCVYIIFICSMVSPLNLYSCYNADLNKTFPIGISNDTILSLNMKIHRTNAISLNNAIRGNVINEIKSENNIIAYELGWSINTYIAKYDLSHNLIESIALDSARFYSLEEESIIEELSVMYSRGYNYITEAYKSIELFEPIDIFFCDKSTRCQNLFPPENSGIISESDINEILSILRNKFDVNLYSYDNPKDILFSSLSSVRKYTSEKFDMFVIHIQIGQILGDEKTPQVALWNDIKHAIYEEPILYHGDRYDVFYCKKNK